MLDVSFCAMTSAMTVAALERGKGSRAPIGRNGSQVCVRTMAFRLASQEFYAQWPRSLGSAIQD